MSDVPDIVPLTDPTVNRVQRCQRVATGLKLDLRNEGGVEFSYIVPFDAPITWNGAARDWQDAVNELAFSLGAGLRVDVRLVWGDDVEQAVREAHFTVVR